MKRLVLTVDKNNLSKNCLQFNFCLFYKGLSKRLRNMGFSTRSAILNSNAGRESHRSLSSCCFLSCLRLPSQRLDFARITRFSVTTRSPASFVTLSRTHSPAARPLLSLRRQLYTSRLHCHAIAIAMHCNCHCHALPYSPFWEIVL